MFQENGRSYVAAAEVVVVYTNHHHWILELEDKFEKGAIFLDDQRKKSLFNVFFLFLFAMIWSSDTEIKFWIIASSSYLILALCP